eukprot:symbB.v1.2.027206.t1/scaffold2774.1/size70796/4
MALQQHLLNFWLHERDLQTPGLQCIAATTVMEAPPLEPRCGMTSNWICPWNRHNWQLLLLSAVHIPWYVGEVGLP